MGLNNEFRQIAQEIPKLLLTQLVSEKLADCGIDEDETLAKSIAEHIIRGEKTDFHLEDGTYDDIRLSFNKEDAEELTRRLDKFFKESLPDVVNRIVKDSGKSLVRRLQKNWPEQVIHERCEMQSFRERLDLRWGKGLDSLRMLLTCSREIGEEFANALMRSKAKKGLLRRNVLMLLHMRACQTTMEIITLLESGLADGAFARWRTLYEVGVMAAIVDLYGDDIAQRYLDHDAVAMKRSMDNELKFYGSDGNGSISKSRQREINDEFRQVISKYGSSFGGSYGWAAKELQKKDPKFRDLEEAAGRVSLSPMYKWASFKVHANVSGLIRHLGYISDAGVGLAGASNAGLEQPATNTAYTLTQITSLLMSKSKKLEDMIQLDGMCELRNIVERECNKAAQKLYKDEKKQSRNIVFQT